METDYSQRTKVLLIVVAIFIAIFFLNVSLNHISTHNTYPGYHRFNSKQELRKSNYNAIGSPVIENKDPIQFPSGNFSTFDEFIDEYGRWTSSISKDSIPDRFICFQPNENGMGNKIFGFISSVFYAMVSKRAFMICNFPSFHAYFRTPYNIPLYETSSLSTIPIKYLRKCGQGFPELTKEPLFPTNDNSSYIYDTNCKLILYYIQNPTFLKRLNEMGLSINKKTSKWNVSKFIYKRLLHKFLLPSVSIEERMNKMLLSWKDYYVIGVHIRAGDRVSFGNTHYGVTPYEERKQMMINATLLRTKQVNKDNVKWFILSDYQLIKEEIVEEYPQYAFYYQSKIKHSGLLGHSIVNEETYDTVLELFLLSKTDEMVISSVTTYAEAASLISDSFVTMVRMNNTFNVSKL